MECYDMQNCYLIVWNYLIFTFKSNNKYHKYFIYYNYNVFNTNLKN